MNFCTTQVRVRRGTPCLCESAVAHLELAGDGGRLDCGHERGVWGVATDGVRY